MTPSTVIITVAAYFAVMLAVGWLASKGADNQGSQWHLHNLYYAALLAVTRNRELTRVITALVSKLMPFMKTKIILLI